MKKRDSHAQQTQTHRKTAGIQAIGRGTQSPIHRIHPSSPVGRRSILPPPNRRLFATSAVKTPLTPPPLDPQPQIFADVRRFCQTASIPEGCQPVAGGRAQRHHRKPAPKNPPAPRQGCQRVESSLNARISAASFAASRAFSGVPQRIAPIHSHAFAITPSSLHPICDPLRPLRLKPR